MTFFLAGNKNYSFTLESVVSTCCDFSHSKDCLSKNLKKDFPHFLETVCSLDSIAVKQSGIIMEKLQSVCLQEGKFDDAVKLYWLICRVCIFICPYVRTLLPLIARVALDRSF